MISQPLSSAASTTTTAAAKRSRAGGTPAPLVHRLEVRRGAADGLGGVFQGLKCCPGSGKVVVPFLVFLAAGGVADLGAGSGPPSTYCSFDVFVLCTVYVVRW